MRILAIRGENLASLEGRFDVDLEGEHLGKVGLYAITGPTGAGKSTLLDALCLALFDRTPRLGARGGVLVGRADEPEESRLAATDVRSILRRGAAEGYAEVDFRGRDGRRYRSRWAVRRANRRADGRVQAQTLTLHDLDAGTQLGGTRTETLQAIEDRLGLSFDQFRRSALLAQGDFAAFLRADAGQRAELLERVSGTHLYGQVSIAAHQRAQQARNALKELRAAADATPVLAPELRAALEAQVAERAEQLRQARAALEVARRASEWHAARGRLAEAVAAAESEQSEAEAAWEAAEDAREALRALERVQPLRPALAERDRAARALAEALSERDATQAAREGAEAAHAAAEARAAEARAEATRVDAERRALQPELTAAVACDEALEAARRAARQADDDAAQAERLAAEAEAALASAAEALESAQREQGEVDAWLEAQAAWGRLARESGLLGDLLERAAAALSEREDAQRVRLGRAEACEAAREAGRVAREALEAASAALEEARVERAVAEAAEDAARRAREAAPAEAARRRVAALGRLERRAEAVAQAWDRVERERQALATARAEARKAEDEALDHTGRAMEVIARRDEAARTLERMKAVMALEAHRADLVDGEPCPLCGSREHPFAAQTVPMAMAMAEQKERVNVLSAESDDLHAKLVDARGREAGWRQTAAEAAARVEAAEAEWAEARACWAEARQADDLGAPEDAAAARMWLVDEAAEAARALEAAERAEAEAATRAAEARQARERHEAARAAWQAAQDAVREHERRLAEAELARAEAERRQADAEAVEKRVREALGRLVREVAPDWEGRLARSPERFGREVEAGTARWRAQAERRDALADSLGKLRPEVARLGEAAARARQGATERRAAAEAARARVAEVAGRRAALLGGRPVAEVAEAVERRVAQAAEAAREAELGAQEAAKAAASAGARSAAAAGAVAHAEEVLAAATRALDVRLAALGMTVEAARALLERAPGEVAALRERLEALAARRHEAGAVVDERRRQLAAHEATDPPALGPAEAAEALAARAAEAEAAEAALHTARVELHRDDDARRRLAEMADTLARAEAEADLWASMAELIGSHDGKKLRVFAQSLTLDLLLAYANRHLRDLARRYQLVRVPGHDLDLQVIDRDMGDEARGVQSLSGGESFLVSLALALGLSSLSSRTTPVESLFIDEGFGSLDARTLETALDALDALQATGCQVGLISHVPGVAERIGVRVHVQPEGAGRSSVRIVVG